MSTILFTDPAHDETTRLLSGWIKSVAEYIDGLEGSKHVIVGLTGTKATKADLIDECEKSVPRLIMINGHGNKSTLCGHGDQPIIEETDTDNSHLNMSIVHALACSAAQSLGHKMVDDGVETFIGYNEDFHFYHDVKPGQDIIDDPLSSLFLEPAYQIPKSLADGLNAKEAYDKSQAMSQQNLLMALRTNVSQNVLASLFHNFKSHTIIGNPDSSI